MQNTPLGQGGTKGTHHGGLTVVSAGSRWREEGNFSHGQGGSTGTYHRGPTVVPTTPGGLTCAESCICTTPTKYILDGQVKGQWDEQGSQGMQGITEPAHV